MELEEAELQRTNLIETHRHNLVAINDTLRALLECFDGHSNLESLFHQLRDDQNEFVVYTIEINTAANSLVTSERKIFSIRQRFEAVGSVYDIMARVIARSQRDGISTLDAARAIALERIHQVGKVRRILS